LRDVDRSLCDVDPGQQNIDRGLRDIDRGLQTIDRSLCDIDRGLRDVDRGLPCIDRGQGDVDRGPRTLTRYPWTRCPYPAIPHREACSAGGPSTALCSNGRCSCAARSSPYPKRSSTWSVSRPSLRARHISDCGRAWKASASTISPG